MVKDDDGGWSALPNAPRLQVFGDVIELVAAISPLYVRFSAGPLADSRTASRDYESGCLLPGLSVNPLTPEPWWDRPPGHWLARQLCQYSHLMSAKRYPWALTGEVVGRGPDCEPLLARTVPVALIAREVIDEAEAIYRREFRPADDGT